MRNFVVSVLITLLLFTIGCRGEASYKTSINRTFAGLSLGMTKEEYKKAGWIFGSTEYAYIGPQHSVRYLAIELPEFLGNDIANSKNLEMRYPDELKDVNAVRCVFFNDKLCQIEIGWYAENTVPWDAFSQKAIDKYGKPINTGINSYTWNDGKTSLAIKKDYYVSESRIHNTTYNLNVALYADTQLYSRLKEYQKKSSPER